jgi:hypothetical protein
MKRMVVAILIAAILTGSDEARAAEKILFFDFESTATASEVANRINASLRSWVASSDGLSSIYGKSLAETRQAHCKSALLQRSFHTCLAQLGVTFRADRLILGSVLPDGSDYRVVLTIIDTRTPQVPFTVTERLVAASTQGPALETWIRKLFSRLFGSDLGYLIVTCNVDGVEVEIDGQSVGQCNTGITRLRTFAGNQKATFRRAGYLTTQQWVTVRGGETTRLNLALRPAPTPRLPTAAPPPTGTTPAGVMPPAKTHRHGRRLAWKALFFTTLGTGAAFLVASIVTGLKAQSLRHDISDFVTASYSGPANTWLDEEPVCVHNQGNLALVNVCNKEHRMSHTTYALVGVGAGLVVTSAVFLYYAYVAKPKSHERAAGRSSTVPSFTWVPQVWEKGGGFSAHLRF